MAKTKLRPGKGAIGLVLIRFIVPQQPLDDKNDRCGVVLIDRFLNDKKKLCYNFTYDGDDDGGAPMHAPAHYVKILEEGDITEMFDAPTGPGPGAGEAPPSEPKVKWKNSVARSILYKDLKKGIVPLVADGSLRLKDIYAMHPEYAEYSYQKFSSRLSSIRKSVLEKNKRAESDKIALAAYVANHPVSLFTHRGFEEWQGSMAQTLLLEDLSNQLHLTLGKKELYGLRPEYYEEFPYAVFRAKFKQEIKTGKYLHTLKVKGKQHKSS